MRKLILWHNLNKDTYYHKFVEGTYTKYYVGMKNQYNHVVVDVIEHSDFQPVIEKKYVSIRKMVLTPIIAFLQKINK